MRSEQSPVSFIAHVARLPKNGMPVTIEADEKQRIALAAEHGLDEVKRYHADLLVTSWKSGGIRVSGTVASDIVQTCVVTLEPIESRIDETVSAVFLPENSKLIPFDLHRSAEVVLDAEGPDSPETFSGDTIDVGSLAEEFFALAIDPYPRKPGAELPIKVDDAGDADVKESGPLYEKLKSLKPNG
jgi:hypothetical protein